MRLYTLLVLVLAAMFLITACELQMPEEAQEFPIDLGEITPEEEAEEIITPEEGIVIKATEGDLVELKPEAIDPDGDMVYYSFTEPFNENGRWQTKEGDEGQYLVTVTASDGKDSTSQDILVIIKKGNKAPVIECPEEVIVKEGDIINLECNIYDPEADSVIVEYSGFMKTSIYETTFEDAGEYTVQIKARDKEKETEATVKIKILDTNRVPEIKGVPDQIIAMETELISLTPQVEDLDGDEISITFSEPFNENGVWRTMIGDSGTHKATVLASDGKSTIKKEVEIIITQKNTAPVLKKINDIEVFEGETIEIPISATDREGDELVLEIKGWMNSQTYTTTYEDAGEYTVTVIISDEELETKQTFKVTVIDRNRPPIFKVPA